MFKIEDRNNPNYFFYGEKVTFIDYFSDVKVRGFRGNSMSLWFKGSKKSYQIVLNKAKANYDYERGF